jgi:lipoyl(octanoyl) transferase
MTDGPRPSAPHLLRADAGAPVAVARLGTVGYLDAWDLQRHLVAERQADQGRDTLLLLEHPAVYTLGKRADRTHVLLDDAELTRRGIEVIDVDRGGDVTYHGPGQLVGYPILRLAGTRGVVDYVRALEEALIRVLASLGVSGERSTGYTGVWVGDEKIAAIGVRVASRGVTSHGFALNVDPDLSDFAGIVPCGIPDRGVCSLASLGVEVAMDAVCDTVEQAFATVFDATLEPVGLDAVAPATSLPKVSP